MGRLPTPSEVLAILVDVRNPRRLFAAGSGGLFSSVDAGRTWQAISGAPGGGKLVALAQDPRRPNVLYAAAASGILYRSADGGVTWSPVR